MGGNLQEHGLIPFQIGGIEDHVHPVVSSTPSMALANAVLLIKSNSSKWMNETKAAFAWQEGYGAFNVSASNVESVKKYILHRKSITVR